MLSHSTKKKKELKKQVMEKIARILDIVVLFAMSVVCFVGLFGDGSDFWTRLLSLIGLIVVAKLFARSIRIAFPKLYGKIMDEEV